MESWMINLGSIIVGGIATYAVLQYRVKQIEFDSSNIKSDLNSYVKDTDKRMEHGFRRFEELNNAITILKENTKEHLGIREAEDKFVSKEMLQLHLRTIENDLVYVKESNAALGKKLDKLTDLLSTNIVKTIAPHTSVFSSSDN